MKPCARCHVEKSLDDFYNYKKGKDGKHYWCRSCAQAEAKRAYAEKHSLKQRDQHFMRKYGITIAERDALIAAQGGCCAICGSSENESRWAVLAVDHDHTSNTVRGMLCDHCNRGLGHFRDDPNLLLSAAAYLMQNVNLLAPTEP